MFESLVMFAQEDYGGGEAAGGLMAMLCPLVIAFAIMGALLWGVFKKAGVTPWWGFIPILNYVGMVQVARRPVWWVVLMLIPFVNFVIAIILSIDVAKKFGQGVGTVVALILVPFIMLPILGYGSATYDGSRTQLA